MEGMPFQQRLSRPRIGALVAALALGLAGCVATAPEPGPPRAAAAPVPAIPPRPVRVIEYTPDAAATAPTARRGRDAAPTTDRGQGDNGRQAPKPRRGSSTPPQLLFPPPVAAPEARPPAAVPSTQNATDAFKRDLLAPRVDDLRAQDAQGRLDPFGQRDLFRREQELYDIGKGPPVR